MSAYFVTATGTGVGKTFTTCALLYAARMRGVPIRGLKPVISGWDGSPETDTAQIIGAAGAGEVNDVSPWRFTAPLSAHQAAALEGKSLDIDALTRWTATQTQGDTLTLVEGVGGVMAPLTEQHTVLDWMDALQLPVILVVGSYLGAMSHTLTALEVLRARKLRVAALVINETPGSTVTLAQAQSGLEPFLTDIPLRYCQPLVSSWKEAHAIHAMLKDLR